MSTIIKYDGSKAVALGEKGTLGGAGGNGGIAISAEVWTEGKFKFTKVPPTESMHGPWYPKNKPLMYIEWDGGAIGGVWENGQIIRYLATFSKLDMNDIKFLRKYVSI